MSTHRTSLVEPTSKTELVDVGLFEDFPIGEFKVVDVNGNEIGVLRSEDGRVRAIRNLCPHHLAPLCEGRVTGTMLPTEDPAGRTFGMEGDVIRCPWHAYEFDINTGRSLFDTYSGRVQTYETEVVDGRVHVRVQSRR